MEPEDGQQAWLPSSQKGSPGVVALSVSPLTHHWPGLAHVD